MEELLMKTNSVKNWNEYPEILIIFLILIKLDDNDDKDKTRVSSEGQRAHA